MSCHAVLWSYLASFPELYPSIVVFDRLRALPATPPLEVSLSLSTDFLVREFRINPAESVSMREV